MKRHLFVPFVLAGCLTATLAHASLPAGVWVKVQSVTFEPNESAPTRIRIAGAVLLYKGPSDVSYLDAYTPPALGYLYYECPSGDGAQCLLEWPEIQKNIVAPPEKCVGLGSQSIPTGTLRRLGATPANPDAYPIAMGVVDGYTPCQALADFLKTQPDGGIGGGTGGVSGAGGATAGAGGAVHSSGGASATGGASAAGGASAGGRTGAAGTPSVGTGGKVGTGGATVTGNVPGKDESGGASSGGRQSSATSNGGAPDEEEEPTTKTAAKIPEDKGCNVTPAARSPWTFGLALIGVALGLASRRRNRTR